MVFRRKKARRSNKRASIRARSRGSGNSSNPLMIILPAMVYGAGRQYLSNMAQPLTSKIPLGNYADEALFGLAGYFMAKKGKGIVKNIGTSMLIVESASLGNQLLGQIGTSSNVSTGYVYQ